MELNNEKLLELFRASKFLSFTKFLTWYMDVEAKKALKHAEGVCDE